MGGVVSRGIVTWVELVVVGFAGAAVAGVTSGPPELVVYLATTLTSVVVLLYNVARLVDARVADARQTATAGGDTDDGTDTRAGDDTDNATSTRGDGVV